jgi:hypothetical protein
MIVQRAAQVIEFRERYTKASDQARLAQAAMARAMAAVKARSA